LTATCTALKKINKNDQQNQALSDEMITAFGKWSLTYPQFIKSAIKFNRGPGRKIMVWGRANPAEAKSGIGQGQVTWQGNCAA
jgi:hypothetical protein